MYAGAPDILVHDTGSNFTAEEFKECAGELGIVLKCIPVEAHEQIGAVERRHVVVRAVYKKLTLDLPKISAPDRLSLTFRAINDVPDSTTGVCPTTLVFGVYHKLPGSGNRGSMTKRAKVIAEATKLAEKMRARRVIRDSMSPGHAPSMKEVEKIRCLPPGTDVLVFLENTGWVQYKLAEVKGNEVGVILHSGKISYFGIHMVRKLYENDDQQSSVSTSESNGHLVDEEVQAFVSLEESGEDFADSRLDELEGLSQIGTFKVVDISESEGHRLYNSVFVDLIKKDGTKKSRFCVAAFNDKEHQLFTAAPTITRKSLRLLVALCEMFGFAMYTRDIVKAFIQSKTVLRRPVFVRAPQEMNLAKRAVLKVIKPLYGMPESPIHWFRTFLQHHTIKMSMCKVPMDPCLLYTEDFGVLQGLLGMQVDDILFGGTKSFLEREEHFAGDFPNKGRKKISEEFVRFNGIEILRCEAGYQLSQVSYVKDIPMIPKDDDLSFEDFRSIRAKYAYLAYSTMPDILVIVSKLSQVTNDIYESDRKSCLKLLKRL